MRVIVEFSQVRDLLARLHIALRDRQQSLEYDVYPNDRE
jgi:hypothetical protein